MSRVAEPESAPSDATVTPSASSVAVGSTPDASSTSDTDVAELLSAGVAAARSGAPEEAVAAFRRIAYLHPGSVEAQTHLAFALEAAGDLGAARRAFSVARSVLEHSEPEDLASALQGYRPDELARLLDTKLEEIR